MIYCIKVTSFWKVSMIADIHRCAGVKIHHDGCNHFAARQSKWWYNNGRGRQRSWEKIGFWCAAAGARDSSLVKLSTSFRCWLHPAPTHFNHPPPTTPVQGRFFTERYHWSYKCHDYKWSSKLLFCWFIHLLLGDGLGRLGSAFCLARVLQWSKFNLLIPSWI